jgi:hypothetical protein
MLDEYVITSVCPSKTKDFFFINKISLKEEKDRFYVHKNVYSRVANIIKKRNK